MASTVDQPTGSDMPRVPRTSNLARDGFEIVSHLVSEAMVDSLREALFTTEVAGTRCLLDVPIVREAALAARERLGASGHLAEDAVAIQAIAFDKTPQTNWQVTWHQDLMFPFATPVHAPGYTQASRKDGIDYARPPRDVLERLLAVRIHLDDCDATNGPLRVSPGTHALGIIRSTAIAETVQQHGEITCTANIGDGLLMRPLLLHASSPATAPKHRRVLHLVFYAGPPIAEPWHCAV